MNHASTISTHAPAGGATILITRPSCSRLFLLTPLREGRLREEEKVILCRRISTHAPAGGATAQQICDCCGLLISTHAPAGGATSRQIPARSSFSRISTHAPAGGATSGFRYGKRARSIISTHAPAGGATARHCRRLGRRTFLLTPLREGRRTAYRKTLRLPSHFYSRPCGRGDNMSDCIIQISRISTHAPAGGATVAALGQRIFGRISTHAPAGGATFARSSCVHFFRFLLTPLREGRPASRIACSSRWTAFLLTPLREGRPGTAEMTYECVVFLLTPLREGRPLRCDVRRARMLISTHAPAGGATMVRRRNNVEYPRISTHAPAGGATVPACVTPSASIKFLLTPLREGRHIPASTDCSAVIYFYSRPCGRGDKGRIIWQQKTTYFYSRPCGRGDMLDLESRAFDKIFLLTPLREGRQQFSTSPS